MFPRIPIQRVPITRAWQDARRHQRAIELRGQWTDIGDEACQLLEFPDRSKLEQAFNEFCDRTAREQVRSEQRLLFTNIAAVAIALVVMVVLASLSTGVVRGGDWLVTAVSLVALGVLRTQLSRHRTAVLAGVLLVLAIEGAAWSTSSPAAPEPMSVLAWLAAEPHGFALGVFLASASCLTLLALTGAMRGYRNWMETLRHRTEVPDVMAFARLHEIVTDMLDAGKTPSAAAAAVIVVLAFLAPRTLVERAVDIDAWAGFPRWLIDSVRKDHSD